MARSEIKFLAEKMANAVLSDMADKVQFEISNRAKEVINEFYEEYTPTAYWRTKNLYRSFEPIKRRTSGKSYYRSNIGYEVGVRFSPDAMFENYHQSKNTVFSFAIGQGIHGGIQFINGSSRQFQYESPVSKMKKFMDTLDPNKYVQDCQSRALSKYGAEINKMVAQQLQKK